MQRECLRKGLMMSGIRASAVSAAERLPPEPREKPKRGEGKEPPPRRGARPKTADADIAAAEPRKLNVSV
jgi:hypothetical protein